MIHTAMVAVACMIMIGLSLVSPRLVDRIVYDERPAMVIWDLKVQSTKLAPGEPMVIKFFYSKRPECYAPHGSGEVEYRLWPWDPKLGFARFSVISNSVSFAVPATAAYRETMIPLPMLAPGHYALQSKATFRCKGGRDAMIPELWTDMWVFDVVDGAKR